MTNKPLLFDKENEVEYNLINVIVRGHNMEIIFLLLCFASFILSFFVSDIYFTVLAFFGIYFIVFLQVGIHELGHVVGCLIKKRRIVNVIVCSLSFDSSGIHILKGIDFDGVCHFTKRGSGTKFILALGIVFSILLAILVIGLYFLFSSRTLFVWMTFSVVHAISTLIPFKNSDIRKILGS